MVKIPNYEVTLPIDTQMPDYRDGTNNDDSSLAAVIQAGFTAQRDQLARLYEGLQEEINVLQANGMNVGENGLTGGAVAPGLALDNDTIKTLVEGFSRSIQKLMERTTEGDEGTQNAIRESAEETREEIKETIETESEKEQRLLEEQKQEQAKAAEEIRAQRKADDEHHNKLMNSLNSEIKNLMGGLKQGNTSSVVGTLGNATKYVEGKNGEEGSGGGLATLLGKMGMDVGEGSALGELSSLLSKAGPELALATTAVAALKEGVSAIGNGIDFNQQMRANTIEQTGDAGNAGQNAVMYFGQKAQNDLTAFGTGMNQKQVGDISSGLVKGRAMYGSAEYGQGYDFAVSAFNNYNMGPTQATKLYTDVVVKGHQSMSDLNGIMDELKDTCKKTGKSMSEATDDYIASTKKLAGSFGGSTAEAEKAASDYESYAPGGQASAISGIVSSYDFTKAGPLANKYNELIAQGKSDSNAKFEASFSQLIEGKTGANMSSTAQGVVRDMAYVPIKNGKTVWSYAQDGDATGLAEAIKNPDGGATWKNAAKDKIRNGLIALGANDDDLGTTEMDIANYLIGLTGAYTNAQGATGDSKSAAEEKGDNYSKSKWEDVMGSAKNDAGENSDINALGSKKSLSSYVSDPNSLSYGTSDEVVGYLAQNNLISEKQGQKLDQESQKKLSAQVLDAYQKEKDNTSENGEDYSFSSFVQSDSGKAAISQYVNQSMSSDYLSDADKNSQSNKKDVNVNIKFKGNADKYLYADMQEVSNQMGRDSGDWISIDGS